MQDNIKQEYRRKKRGAVRGVAIFALLQSAGAACIGAICFIPGIPRWVSIPCLALAVLPLLLILPAIWALKERFKEIEGGELDAADKY